jgi:hypothetical protein
MRRITSVLAVFILLFAALAATPATTARERATEPANLITNPGFEEGTYDPAGAPPGWGSHQWNTIGPAQLTWDTAVVHSGSRSVKIVAAAQPDDAYWSQVVPVQPHTLYRFSAWVKTENVQHSIQVNDAGANLSHYPTWTRTAGLWGTNDWTWLSLTFDSGDSATAEVALRLGHGSGNSLGTVWYDDAELVPDEEQPTHAEMAIEDIKEKVNELIDDGVLARDRGEPMVGRLDAALRALWDHRPARAVRELRDFNTLVRAAMSEGALPRYEGRPLIDASNATIAELQP